MEHLVLLLFLFFVVVVVKAIVNSPEYRGRRGEKFVNRQLANLPADKYVSCLNLLLPVASGGETTEIDHVVFSRHGVFVLETKNYNGWIFGEEKSRYWTQIIYRTKHKFQNPLRQNYKHIKTLQQITGLSDKHFHNLVVFVGDTQFKNNLPNHVISGRRARQLCRIIAQYDAILLSEDEINHAVAAVRQHNRREVAGAARAHVRHLRAKHGK